jgi:hypothetical protein
LYPTWNGESITETKPLNSKKWYLKLEYSLCRTEKKTDIKFELLLLFLVPHGAHVVLLFAFPDLPGVLCFLLPEKDIASSHIEECYVT